MNLKRLEEANKGFEMLKQLDAEIIAMDRIAMDIAEKKTELTFSLDVKLEKEEKYVDPEQGGYIPMSYLLLGGLGGSGSSSSKKEEKHGLFKQDIQDTTALQILGLLIQEKQEKRAKILQVFEKWGIQI